MNLDQNRQKEELIIPFRELRVYFGRKRKQGAQVLALYELC